MYLWRSDDVCERLEIQVKSDLNRSRLPPLRSSQRDVDGRYSLQARGSFPQQGDALCKRLYTTILLVIFDALPSS